MKKLLAAILVVALCAPAMAGTITFGTPDTSTAGEVTIPWTADEGVVGMGIIVTTDDSIDSFTVDSFFDILIDVAFEAGSGYAYGDGFEEDGTTCLKGAIIGDPGVELLPSAAFSISVGGLGGSEAPLDPAPTTGSIVLKAAAGAANVDLVEDALRGGIVGYNGAMTVVGLPTDITIPEIPSGDCYTEAGFGPGDAEYDDWAALGKPECWCFPTQCHGDADGQEVAATKTVPAHYVGTPDLTILSTAWKVPTVNIPAGDQMLCADFDHAEIAATKTVPAHRVGTPDLTILSTYWKDAATPADCTPGTRTP